MANSNHNLILLLAIICLMMDNISAITKGDKTIFSHSDMYCFLYTTILVLIFPTIFFQNSFDNSYQGQFNLTQRLAIHKINNFFYQNINFSLKKGI